MTRVRKAVFPVAGFGTRFLPATKAVPKELLPVVDQPALQYVVEEAAAAGLDQVVLVTNATKGSVLAHFQPNPDLEAALERSGNAELLARVHAASQLAQVSTVDQDEPRGLGHAVLCAKDAVGDEPFAVLLGDDLIDPRDPVLSEMAAVRDAYGGSVVCLMRVPIESISLCRYRTRIPMRAM